jgi:hypothetical protein
MMADSLLLYHFYEAWCQFAHNYVYITTRCHKVAKIRLMYPNVLYTTLELYSSKRPKKKVVVFIATNPLLIYIYIYIFSKQHAFFLTSSENRLFMATTTATTTTTKQQQLLFSLNYSLDESPLRLPFPAPPPLFLHHCCPLCRSE